MIKTHESDKDLFCAFDQACNGLQTQNSRLSVQELESLLEVLSTLMEKTYTHEYREAMGQRLTEFITSSATSGPKELERAALKGMIKWAVNWPNSVLCAKVAEVAILQFKAGHLLLSHAKMIVLGMNELCPSTDTRTSVARIEQIMLCHINPDVY